MAKVSNYARTQIELLHKQGLLPAELFRSLKADGLLVSISSIVCIMKKLKITGSVANLPCSGRPTKIGVLTCCLRDASANRPLAYYLHALLEDIFAIQTLKNKIMKAG